MPTIRTLNASNADPSICLLGKLFAAATQHASVAMCHWTNGQVTLEVDELRAAPIEEATALLEMGDDPLTMIVLGVQGLAGGQLILSFDELSGRRLAACLLQRPVNDDPQWSALEKSAVMETGNILGSAYLNELTRLTDCEMTPSAPYFVQDYGASVVEQALMMQAMASDRVLVCRTRFQLNKEDLNWNVVFVPDESLVHVMRKSIHADC